MHHEVLALRLCKMHCTIIHNSCVLCPIVQYYTALIEKYEENEITANKQISYSAKRVE